MAPPSIHATCWSLERPRPRRCYRAPVRTRRLHLTLLARRTDGLAKLASDLADAGAAVDTVAADASDPETCAPPSPRCMRAPARRGPSLQRIDADAGLAAEQRRRPPAPGLRRRCRRGHRGHAGRCPAMRAAGGGAILFTGGGWADHPGPAWGTVSLGKAALRSAATMSVPAWRRRHTRRPHHHRRADPTGHTVQSGPDCREVLVGRAIRRHLAKRIRFDGT